MTLLLGDLIARGQLLCIIFSLMTRKVLLGLNAVRGSGIMKIWMYRLIVCFALLTYPLNNCEHTGIAQEAKPDSVTPLTIVGVASVDRVVEHLEELSSKVGLQAELKQYLAWIPDSLDRDRPLGIFTLNAVKSSSQDPPDLDPVILIPVKDAPAFLAHLRDMRLIENLKQTDGVWSFQVSLGNCYALERNGWLFVTPDRRTDFNKIPTDLGNSFLPLSERFDVFAAINPQELPVEIRSRLLKDFFDSANKFEVKDSQENSEGVTLSILQSEISKIVEDRIVSIKQCNAGLILSERESALTLEYNVLLDPGSTASQELRGLSEVPSLFSKFSYEKEAVRSGVKLRLPSILTELATKLIDAQQEQLKEYFIVSKDRFGLANDTKAKLFDEAFSLFRSTLNSRNIEFLNLVGNKQSESVSLIRVTEAKRFEAILQELHSASQIQPKLGQFKLNVEKYKGVDLHSVTLKNLDESGKPIIRFSTNTQSDEFRIAIGISREVVMFSIGDSPIDELKKSLDNTRKITVSRNRDDLISFFEMSLSYAIRQMIAVKNANEVETIPISPSLNDKISSELKIVPDGLKGTFAIQESTLKWLVDEFPRLSRSISGQSLDADESPFQEIPSSDSSSSGKTMTDLNPAPRNRNSGTEIEATEAEKSLLELARFTDLTWGVKGIDFSPDGKILAAGKPDQMVVMLDIAKQSQGSFVDKLDKLGAAQLCMFTPDGKKLIVGGQTGELAVFAVSKNYQMKQISKFNGHSGEIQCLAISDDGKRALSGDQAKKVFYWDIASGDVLASIGGFEGPVKAVRLATKERIAYATDGARLVEFDLAKKKVASERKLNSSWASGQAAAFSPNGEYVAVGDTYDIRLWNLKTGKERSKLKQKEIQWSMQFTPDSELLLSGGNGRVNIWDVQSSTLKSFQKVNDHVYVQSLTISRDGKLFAVPSNTDVRVFDFSKTKNSQTSDDD